MTVTQAISFCIISFLCIHLSHSFYRVHWFLSCLSHIDGCHAYSCCYVVITTIIFQGSMKVPSVAMP